MSRKKLKPRISNLEPNNGYIAITAAIIITILILSIVATTSSIGYFGRFNILGSFIKEEGDALAEACADTALLELALDIDYTGSTTTNVASSTCEILAITTSGNQKTIKARGLKDNTVTNIEVVLDTNDFTIVSWEEVETF